MISRYYAPKQNHVRMSNCAKSRQSVLMSNCVKSCRTLVSCLYCQIVSNCVESFPILPNLGKSWQIPPQSCQIESRRIAPSLSESCQILLLILKFFRFFVYQVQSCRILPRIGEYLHILSFQITSVVKACQIFPYPAKYRHLVILPNFAQYLGIFIFPFRDASYIGCNFVEFRRFLSNIATSLIAKFAGLRDIDPVVFHNSGTPLRCILELRGDAS